MKSRARWLSLCLAAVGAFAPLRESVAESKVDLEAYLGDVPTESDSRTFLSELGEDNTETATDVFPDAKRTGVMYSSTNAAGDYVNTEFDVVVHGKKLLFGTRTLDDITFFTPKPKKAVSFRLKPGKAYPFSISSKVFLGMQKVGKGKEYGKVTFVGFEEVTTPLGTFPDAAHFKRSHNLRVKSGKQSIESRLTIESWVVAGLGSVRSIQSEDFLENKVVTDSAGPTEWLLDHGIVQGEPIVPMPWVVGSGASASARAEAASALRVETGAGIDLISANASVVTQEFVGLTAVAPGALVGTRSVGDSPVPGQ